MNKIQNVHKNHLTPMNDTNTPPMPNAAPDSEPPDSKTPVEIKPSPDPKPPAVLVKSLTIEQIVEHAAMQLDGLGLDPKLIQKAVILCAEQTDRIAASALHSVLSEHISQLSPPKQARKPRKTASTDQSHA